MCYNKSALKSLVAHADLVFAKAFEGNGKICFGDSGHFDC